MTSSSKLPGPHKRAATAFTFAFTLTHLNLISTPTPTSTIHHCSLRWFRPACSKLAAITAATQRFLCILCWQNTTPPFAIPIERRQRALAITLKIASPSPQPDNGNWHSTIVSLTFCEASASEFLLSSVACDLPSAAVSPISEGRYGRQQ